MAEIPSDIATSAAQAGFKARDVGKERDGQRAGQANAANRQVRSLDEAGGTVETTDADTQVFTDAEGGGSQGRQIEEETAQQPEEASDSADTGITTDEEGRPHVDLEA